MSRHITSIMLAIIKKREREKITNVSKDVQKLEHLYIADDKIKWCSFCVRQYEYGGFSKKLCIELSYKPAIPLLSIHWKEFKAGTQTGICTPVFITTLFTIAKRWKQLECSLIDKWINNMWYITYEVISFNLKTEWNFGMCYTMYLPWRYT